MYILYGLALVSFSLSYLFFKLNKKIIGNTLVTIAMFLNPLGYDLVLYSITLLTNNYWITISIMYVLSAIFFGLFIFLYGLNPIKQTHNKIKANFNKMGKTFDELYNDFFNKGGDKKSRKIDSLRTKITDSSDVEKEIKDLGKPDKIDFYNDGHLFFEKRIWHTKNGDIVKIIVSDEPTLNMLSFKEKSLDEKLADAVENENYEKACHLRDLINIEKTKKIKKS